MNKYRGEVSIDLGGREYILRPTFEVLVEIEERLGIGLLAIARKFMNREYGIRDVSIIIAAGIKGGGQKIPENLGEVLATTGVLPFHEKLEKFIAGSLSGESEQGNAGASTGKINQFPGDAIKKSG
ncbi:MAG: gene transfer agent family protein [Alphaproteobacteria bacterium]